MMPDATIEARKRLLTILLVALFGSVLIYIGLTYMMNLPPRPEAVESQKLFKSILVIVAVLNFLIGMALERYQLGKVKSPGEVQMALIISAALGEAIAIYGLLWYFISAQREWYFFGASLLYFLRLFMRLPEFHRLIEETSR